MTNHQQYVDWITSDDTLPTDCARELREHTLQCARCRALAEGWTSARRTIQASGMEPAPAGFARRWKALAAERTHTPAPRQAWAFLGATGLASIAVGTALAFQTFAEGFSLSSAIAHSLSFAAGAVDDLSATNAALETIVPTLYRSASPVLWIGVIALMAGVFAVWMAFLYRLARTGVKQ
jgi:anti-sigma factor RsiW